MFVYDIMFVMIGFIIDVDVVVLCWVLIVEDEVFICMDLVEML